MKNDAGIIGVSVCRNPFNSPTPQDISKLVWQVFICSFFGFFSREKSAGPYFAPSRVTPVKILDSLKELNTRTSADGKLHFISLENSSILDIGDESCRQKHKLDIFTLIAHHDDFKYMS